MSTAISLAFADAGYVEPGKRLRAIMSHSLDTAPERAVDPLPSVNVDRLKAVAMESVIKSPRNWDGAKDAFFRAVRNDAELLWALLEPYRAAAAQRILAEVSAERHAARVAADLEPERRQVFAKDIVKPAPREIARASAAVARLTVLDTFKVNGRPIGDLTAAEASKWASSRERDARFVRLLTQNLPPDQPIRKFRTGPDATALYAQAEAGADE